MSRKKYRFRLFGMILLLCVFDDRCLFDNQIKAIDSGAFSLPSLRKVFLFKNNLRHISNSSFEGESLEEIHLYGNNIENISQVATNGSSFPTMWLLSCELLRNVEASNMKIECISPIFVPGLQVNEDLGPRLKAEGFTCEFNKHEATYDCKLCKRGTYAIGDNQCYPCPRGGFYQDEVGFKSASGHEIGCKLCNEGNFVKSEGATSAKDCEVCPPGTNKSMTAGFRACFCKDGYARYDRFGPCYPCNQTGLDCSGLRDYQSVLKGYYWNWAFPGADNEKYAKFVKNLLDEIKDFDNNTFYDNEIPRVFKCPRPESCNTDQSGDAPVLGTCSNGYTGWLCNKCSRGYFSLLKKCVKCPTKIILIVEAIATTTVSAIICYMIWTQYVKHKRQNPDGRNLWDIIVSRIKIILGFYQVLAELFSSLREVRWVGMFDFMAEILSFIRLNILQFLFRPQCFHDSLHINPKTEFFIALSVIFCLTAVPFFFYNVKKAYLYFTLGLASNRSKLEILRGKISTVSLMFLFITYPAICTAIFQIYHRACVEFCPDLKNRNCFTVLRSDFEIHCDSLVVYQVFAYLATAAYIVAFPVILFFLLRKYCAPIVTTPSVNSDIVNDDAEPLISIKYDSINVPVGLKFLCENYKPQFWYWEIIELTRKVTQTVLLTLLGWNAKLTVLLTIGVSVLFLTVHARYRPMKSALEQRLQMFALCAILINVLVAAMTMTVPDGTEQRLAVILLLLNISVFAILIIEAVFGVIVQVKKLKFYRMIYDPTQRQKKASKETEKVEEK